ncbi:MarR family winged helix-turn-helix transcriptional regulator [Sphingopyxis alaskensis]|jgi:DNA-binding MarR family transcriptional regulator|uniref:Transcriptional regulator, MarR family n=1 Tax=Sphingopyxis alaskensis (strain DSM 13593 / LMG 18877 / RB2256) TaxID=317655 RepID=Q1GNW9_SPHAL|nr:MarR family transcriptional regulator [Sphingopyxis alaskensis]ABF54653.1 transcriptional regulator, MarR family [Sphingopyxis alaskensis RB2256]MCM3418506.1 MarR family transcriptional regulator [Sphingopyxis alaskensis]
MESEIATATLKALRRVLRAAEGGTRRIAAATGLTPSQLLVLREIDAGGNVTPGLVAQRLEFGHATVTAIVDRLVALDLATRSRSAEDKRRVLLAATGKGRRCLAEAPDMLQEIFAARFAALPAWEQAMILAGTERLADILGVREMDAAPLLDTGAIDRI